MKASLIEKLPKQCYALSPTGSIVLIRRGHEGYFDVEITVQTDKPCEAISLERIVDDLNKPLGVTPAQRQAMLAGSLVGWHTKAADPDNYTADGTLVGTAPRTSTFCVYCGEAIKHKDVPIAEAHRRMIEHDRTCEKNPLVVALKQIASLGTTLNQLGRLSLELPQAYGSAKQIAERATALAKEALEGGSQ